MSIHGHDDRLPPELDIHRPNAGGNAIYADPREIQRTNPDFRLYDPTGGRRREWDDPDFFWLNEQVLVVPLHDGSLLATWTSERLTPHLLRIMQAKSFDGGATWTEARFIDGDGLNGSGPAAWQVPVVTSSGTVYLFYMYNPVPGSGGFGGTMRCRVSHDHAESWSPPADLPVPRGRYDAEDESLLPIWVSISVPLRDSSNRPLIAFTRWATRTDVPAGGRVNIKERHSHIEILRIENIESSPRPDEVSMVPLLLENPITAAHATVPGASFAQEPYLVRLPDQRLFMVLRTNRGEAWFTISEDEGESWNPAEPMRYSDSGPVMKQCVSPCPVYHLAEGRYLFLFNNNDGYAFGAESRWDVRNRRPGYLCHGSFDPHARQPIRWEGPKLFIENGGVPWGPEGLFRYEAAAYPSLTTGNGRSILWYPDRKGFLVGKIIRKR